jgi:hypothetical protein
VSHVRCELGFYIPEDGILHSHGHENLKSYKSDTDGSSRATVSEVSIFQRAEQAETRCSSADAAEYGTN